MSDTSTSFTVLTFLSYLPNRVAVVFWAQRRSLTLFRLKVNYIYPSLIRHHDAIMFELYVLHPSLYIEFKTVCSSPDFLNSIPACCHKQLSAMWRIIQMQRQTLSRIPASSLIGVSDACILPSPPSSLRLHQEFIKHLSDGVSPVLLFYPIGSPLILNRCP